MVSGGSDGGDRIEGTPNLGGYGIALALILSIIVAGGLAYSSGQESERRNQYPANYTETAKESALRSCGGIEPATVFDCIYEKVESSQETARAEQDLDAQQGMKFWAIWMFIATLSTVAVTSIGVYYVKRTLDTNSDFLKESINATAAMNDANDIARNAQRPWITVKGYAAIEVRNSVVTDSELYERAEIEQGVAAQAIWTNTGARPASGISFQGRAFLAPFDASPPEYRFPDPDPTQGGRSLAVGQTINADLFVLDDADTARFKRREIAVIVYTRCRYELAPGSGEYGESITCLRVTFRSLDGHVDFDQSTALFSNANYPDSYR